MLFGAIGQRNIFVTYLCDKEERRSRCALSERVVIVCSKQKNRGAWMLGVLIEMITRKDSVIHGAKVCTVKSTAE